MQQRIISVLEKIANGIIEASPEDDFSSIEGCYEIGGSTGGYNEAIETGLLKLKPVRLRNNKTAEYKVGLRDGPYYALSTLNPSLITIPYWGQEELDTSMSPEPGDLLFSTKRGNVIGTS